MIFEEKLPDFQPGDRIAGYTVLHVAGSGGSGTLYLVQDVSGADWILKLLRRRDASELDALKCFRQISRIPGMIAIHAADTLPDGRVFYLMDAADNLLEPPLYLADTLANRLARHGRLSAEDVLQLAGELLEILVHLHKQGVAHFDLKPENILFCNGRAVLGDFGSLSVISENREQAPAGTSGFLPPESGPGAPCGPQSEQRDLFALGMTLYCAWSGREPEEFPRLPDPADPRSIRMVAKLCDKACNADPSRRFASAEDFLAAVRQAKRRPVQQKRFRLWKLVLPATLPVLLLLLFAWKTGSLMLEVKLSTAQMAEEDNIRQDLESYREFMTPEEQKELDMERILLPFEQMHNLITLRRNGANKIRQMAAAYRAPSFFQDARRDPAIREWLHSRLKPTPSQERQLQEWEKSIGTRHDALKRNLTGLPHSAPRGNTPHLPALQKELEAFERKHAVPLRALHIAGILRRDFSNEQEALSFLRLRKELDGLIPPQE